MGSDLPGQIDGTASLDFNPRSPCGERPALVPAYVRAPPISIHAPLVGSDRHHRIAFRCNANFNPRSPCGERHHYAAKYSIYIVFQSTLPLWGATFMVAYLPQKGKISIHAPLVGSDCCLTCSGRSARISIHAPLVGSDQQGIRRGLRVSNFNPRSPCGERQASSLTGFGTPMISIHAPLVGSDRNRPVHTGIHRYFNPRSPCGERRFPTRFGWKRPLFQSTLPLWGATSVLALGMPISVQFQSTLPLWGATLDNSKTALQTAISIHAPLVGSDSVFSTSQAATRDFNPRSPCGERPGTPLLLSELLIFQSTLPLWGATRSS